MMIAKGLKNIIFDLGGVLIDLDRPRCIRNFKELGFEHIEELIDPFEQEGVFMQLEMGLISPEEFRDKVRKESTSTLTDQQIDDAWNSFLVSIPAERLDMLIELKPHYNIYLLSNTNQIHWDWCKKHAFPYKGYTEEDYFLHSFLSYEMHKTKPGLGIFQQALNHTGILPEETLFIDDSQANCDTARVLGIMTYCPKAGEDWRHLFK